METTLQRVAMVGAGISGMSCAARLESAGLSVTLFEKSRGPGGRITTRRHDSGRYDHGAQYFTAETAAFRDQVYAWSAAGVVAPWVGRFAVWEQGQFSAVEPNRTRWVGQPRMSALGRYLSSNLTLHLQTRIVSIAAGDERWTLRAENGEEYADFDALLLCCPGPQARALLPPQSALASAADRLGYSPCWVLMMDFAEPLSTSFDGCRFQHPALDWAARDSSKPGREPGERWVLHATPAWSEAHIECSAEEVTDRLIREWQRLVPGSPQATSAHRWRYSRALPQADARALFEPETRLGLCGDGLAGPRLEDAWQSGHALADRLLSYAAGQD